MDAGATGRVALHRAGQAAAERLVESFNGRLRDECLNETLFVSLSPHSGVGGLTPADAARRVVQHRFEGHRTNTGLQL